MTICKNCAIIFEERVIEMSQFCCICKTKINDIPFFINENEKVNSAVCSAECMDTYLEMKKKKESSSFLFKEICRIFHLTSPTPRMFMEIKRFHEKEGLSDNNIASILHYMYDVKGENPGYQSIYMVPQYIEEAKAYYKNLKQKEATKASTAAPTKMRELKPNYGDSKKKVIYLNPNDV